MHATTAREESHKRNKIDVDKLNDRVLDGINIEINDACSNGDFSIKYDLTVNLSLSDLLYCQDQLEKAPSCREI